MRRQKTHEKAMSKLSCEAQPPPPMPALEDLDFLCAFYEFKLQELCRDESKHDPSRFTNRVLLTAQSFFKRFYLHASPMVEEPKGIMLASLFLAGKVEQERIQLMDLVPKYAKDLKPEALVALERKLLDSLRFQLVVRSPFRCLVGLLQDLHGVLSEAHRGEAGFAAGQLTSSLEALHRGAIDRVSEALRTDALFVYSPQQIALAALLSAADAAGSKDGGDSVGSGAAVRDFIERRFGTAQSDGADGHGELLPLLQRVAEASVCTFDPTTDDALARLKAIDKQLRKVNKHAKQLEKAEEERRRAVEVEQQRERDRARAAEAKAEDERMTERIRKAEVEAKALLHGDGEAVGDEPFVLHKKRRRTDDTA